MYCSKCGSELPPGAAFCSKCGSHVWQQPNKPSRAVEPQQQSNPTPYNATPGSAGQNEASSRFSPPRPSNPNPFGSTPGSMGQNHCHSPSVSHVEDSGYTRIFGYRKSMVILGVILETVFVFFLWWLYDKIENRVGFGYRDDVLKVFIIATIFSIAFFGYQTFKQTRIKLEVGGNGINGTAGVGFQWFLFSSTVEVIISYKDMDNVSTFMDTNDPSAGIKILSNGTWYHFSVENGQEALELIRQRWQAAKR